MDYRRHRNMFIIDSPFINAGAQLKNGATSAGYLEFFEDSDNGTNKVTLIGPASTSDVTLTLGSTTGTVATTDDVAGEYMRKPAEYAPLSKELVHSVRPDGSVKLTKSIRELQRRWRNTVRINEKLYAPDELMDRAVLDNDGIDIGNVIEMRKTKRTFKGVVVRTHFTVRDRYNLPDCLLYTSPSPRD